MEKLNQIIESMAYAKFTNDSSDDKRIDFIMENAKLGEFIEYYMNKETAHGTPWRIKFKDTTLKNMGALYLSFVEEVLWPRLKDKYMEDVVKGLESKLDAQYKITIEQI